MAVETLKVREKKEVSIKVKFRRLNLQKESIFIGDIVRWTEMVSTTMYGHHQYKDREVFVGMRDITAKVLNFKHRKEPSDTPQGYTMEVISVANVKLLVDVHGLGLFAGELIYRPSKWVHLGLPAKAWEV